MRLVADASEAASILIHTPGAVIAYPTETFYGLGTRISDPQGIERIIRIKGRDAAKGMIVLTDGIEGARSIAVMDDRQEALLNRFWPGPLSAVLVARPNVNPMLSPQGKIAVRVSPLPLARELMQIAGPLTSTSANLSGKAPARTPGEIAAWEPDIDAILDGGSTAGGNPSTLIDLTSWPPRCLREGAVPLKTIMAAFTAR